MYFFFLLQVIDSYRSRLRNFVLKQQEYVGERFFAKKKAKFSIKFLMWILRFRNVDH